MIVFCWLFAPIILLPLLFAIDGSDYTDLNNTESNYADIVGWNKKYIISYFIANDHGPWECYIIFVSFALLNKRSTNNRIIFNPNFYSKLYC